VYDRGREILSISFLSVRDYEYPVLQDNKALHDERKDEIYDTPKSEEDEKMGASYT
jgi:hypothetical protein